MSTNKKVPHGRLKQGFDSPVQPTMRNLSKNIRKTEADLVKLRKENGNRFYQSGDGAHLSQVRRGQIQFSPDGTSLVTLFKEADSSTFVHEMGHLLLRDLLADALEENAGERALNDLAVVKVVTPVRLQMDPTNPKSPTVLTSLYGKGDNKSGLPRNRWFVNQIRKGNLRYINIEKSTSQSSASGLQLPKVLAPTDAFVRTYYRD